MKNKIGGQDDVSMPPLPLSELNRVIYVKDLPRALALYGIKISKRQAIDIATKRRLPFRKCPITGKLCTDHAHIGEVIAAPRPDAKRRFDAEREQQTMRLPIRRGRPRKNGSR